MRNLTSEMQAALQAAIVRPLYFIELEFAESTLRLVTSNRNWSFNEQTWLANNLIVALPQTLQEVTDLEAVGVQITLGGCSTEIRALVLGDTRKSKFGRIYLGLRADDDTLIDDPLLIFEGKFDKAEIRDDGSTSTIGMFYETNMLMIARTNETRYTKFCQESLFPGDKGFDYAPAAENFKGNWGNAQRPQYQRKRKQGRK